LNLAYQGTTLEYYLRQRITTTLSLSLLHDIPPVGPDEEEVKEFRVYIIDVTLKAKSSYEEALRTACVLSRFKVPCCVDLIRAVPRSE